MDHERDETGNVDTTNSNRFINFAGQKFTMQEFDRLTEAQKQNMLEVYYFTLKSKQPEASNRGRKKKRVKK